MSNLGKALVSFITILTLAACGDTSSVEASHETSMVEEPVLMPGENIVEMMERAQKRPGYKEPEPSEEVKQLRAILEEYKP